MAIAFSTAVPVWPVGHSDTWNQMIGFYTAWTSGRYSAACVLRVTAADCYRVWCNGHFAGYGPARTAHGYARVDEWPLGAHRRDGLNHLAIEVLWHGVDSYAYVLQAPFLQAELARGRATVAATGDGFSAHVLTSRVQKVERFSKQRPFAEAYRLTPDCQDWRMGQGVSDAITCEVVSQPELLPRGVPLPTFDCIAMLGVVEAGRVMQKDPAPALPPLAGRRGVGKRFRGFQDEELAVDIAGELNRMDFVAGEAVATADVIRVPAGGYVQVDFGIVQGGFIGARLRCNGPTRVYLAFDELRERPPDQAFALGVGAVVFDLEAGVHEVASIEPYSLRYLHVITRDAAVEVEDIHVREYVHPAADRIAFPGDDPELARIFAAARQTFRTNSVDLFTDCMSRERGGYPCDSWFTAIAERLLTGESRVERNFLENYFLVDTFSSIPAGMVPHCYPSDRLGKGQYIPNWAMWLVIQLCDYCERTGDDALRELARPRVEALFACFAPSQNELGLLEDLPGWIFVEWSPANSYTEGVNHPTNMLYAHCLAVAADLYERADWKEHAGKIRVAVRQESWDGRWFADQSLRVAGKLQRSEGRTETCQYHALTFGIAEGDAFGDLWQRLRDGWGPLRGMRMKWAQGGSGWDRYYADGVSPRADDADLDPAGMLYGFMLRFELLHQYGESDRLIDEIRGVFGPQAALTGTLWEHFDPFSSCNHGFASCICHYLAAAGATDNDAIRTRNP